MQPPAPPAIHALFLRSTVASYVSLFLRLGISFGARLLLARLVLPEGYGLYDLALRVVTIAAAVRDLGLTYHLMRDESRPYGTVFGFTLVSGAVLAAAVGLGAPLFAGLEPDLVPVLRLFAVWILLDALTVVPRTFFDRELRIERLVAPEIARGLVTAAVSLLLAWRGLGVWSLVWGDLVAAAVFALLVWRRAAGEVPTRPQWSLVPQLLRRSAWLLAIWVVVQLVNYVDVFVIQGVMRDPATVGQYARAYWIAFLVPLLGTPRSVVPALVAYRADAQRFLEAFRFGTVFLLVFQVTAGYFLFFNAESVVAILLGRQWGPAVPLLRVLCFVPFLNAFSDMGGEVLKVREEDRTWLAIEALNLTALVVGGVLLTRRFGAQGMAWANFLMLGNLAMAWRLWRIFGPGFASLLRDLALVYLAPLPFFAAAAWCFPGEGWPRLGASAVAGGLALGLLAWRFRQPFRRFFRAVPASPPPGRGRNGSAR